MKQFLVLINLYLGILIPSQISMQYIIESHIDNHQLNLKINVINRSSDYYIIPFDKNGFKGYYESEYCGVFDDKNYPYSFFAPTVMLKKENTTGYLFPGSSRGHVPEGEGAEEYMKKIQEIANKELQEIDKWKKKNHYKSYEDALKNRYITKNLLLLKPNEKYSYEIPLYISNITRANTSTLYDYYFLESARYTLELHLCIKEDAYNWLTEHQKKKLKKYKFFTGIIKSNDCSFKAYE
ncbi:hypothetical protein [uncultured Chryseobacterium sp.]|jgi:hypothetical protein|uniref:hypothetical protein n=1 Tax=uncultured Chryseobacterium sp. TaxID=259322 RepID=UPI002607A8C0|nr:hypothetical protein [uncultured Chryseobacterium sp.]